LIILDIDDFKQINDTYGHLVGDKVLVRFSEILKENLRESDFVARWGGEEFSIMLINTSDEDSYQIAEKLRKMISEDTTLKNLAKREVTSSFGLGSLEHNESIDALISKVDDALYEAKAAGKNKVIIA
jgi:diguanylate cyclase (GGDEF)-like protein